MSRRSRTNARGFTLVEVASVVMIVAIIATLALPGTNTQSDLKASAAARVVVGDLLYAQSQAIATGQKTYVTFTPATANSGNGLYSLYSDSGFTQVLTNPVSLGSYNQTFGSGGSGALVEAGLTALNLDGSSNNVLAFDSLGAPYVCPMTNVAALTPLSSNATITVQAGNVAVTLTIVPDSGDITVSSAQPQ